MFSCYFFNRPNSCSTAFIRSPLKYHSINCKHCHWERWITMCVWNFVLKFIYFYVNMFNAFIYILPFDIHIFSGTVAEQKRYERRKRRGWKSGEKENKLFAENQNRNILISEKVEELILYLECFLLSFINYLLMNGRLELICIQ